MSTDRQALLNLADALSEDIAQMPADELMREVAEDHGYANALADDFDRIVKPLLAQRPSWFGMLAQWISAQLAALLSPRGFAFASIAALCVLAAGALTGSPQIRERLTTELAAWTSGQKGGAGAASHEVHYEAPASPGVAAAPASPGVPAAPTVAAAPPATPPAAATPNVVAPAAVPYVQVLSTKSESDALSSYRVMQKKYSKNLGGREAVIRQSPRGYRAQVGPFANSDDAKGFCESLKTAGGDCFVITDAVP